MRDHGAVSATFPTAVLRAYADLSPVADNSNLVIAPFEELQTLDVVVGADGSGALIDAPGKDLSGNWSRAGAVSRQLEPLVFPRTNAVERMTKLDTLHHEEQLLRHSWVIIAGTTTIDGQRHRVLQPVLSRPIRLARPSLIQRGAAVLEGSPSSGALHHYIGDAEMSPMIADPGARADLLDRAAFGRGSIAHGATEALIARMPEVTGWVKEAAAAMGLPVRRVLPPSEQPQDWIDHDGLVAILVHSLHTARRTSPTSMRSTMLSWAGRPGIDRTAFEAVVAAGSHQPAGIRPEPVDSPLPLSASQQDVVRRSRSERLTVVSGAPGSGKTHALCAVAIDAVARGESVLVATQSRHAAEVIGEMLGRAGGPTPVRFGDGAGMQGLIDELSDRSTHPVQNDRIGTIDWELSRTALEIEALERSIGIDLRNEVLASGADRWSASIPLLSSIAPRVFDVDSDLDHLAALLATATANDERAGQGGWLRRRRARRARRRLDEATGATDDTPIERIAQAIDAARSNRAAATVAADGGVHIGSRWTDLAAARRARRELLGRRLALAPYEADRLDAAARVAIGQLVSALRAGRGRRRELLATMRPGQLTAAAPLWLGTLADIEDVLPGTASLFDLVILDEASQIDQPRAAPALLRARRAVVVGDPYQLRHVSFRSDADIDQALSRHGLGAWRSILDLRRVSAFDLAAAAAPVDHLREHFRSVPHLIEFSVQRFYRDRVQVMTRHPRNETVDAIDVTTVDAPRSSGAKVHDAEVESVIGLLREHLGRDDGSTVGVLSPFREQADALEQRIIDEFSATELAQLGLRVGTVHSFQGGERDTVLISLGLAESDAPGRRRFAESPNLFNVMTTRARRRVVVVTSLPRTTRGLIGEYLRYAEHALPPSDDVSTTDRRWRRELAGELAQFEPVRIGYPVGPWWLDIVLGDGDDARCLETHVLDDNPEAHIERHLMLVDLGWSVDDAFASRWSSAASAAIDLH